MATINRDGTINFGNSKGLLSISEINRKAMEFFVKMQESQDIWDRQERISELRKSCGAEPQYTKIKIGSGA